MKTVGVVTTSRADYGIYRSVLHRLRDHPEFELYLLVSGTHLVAEFGLTVKDIKADGFEIGDTIDAMLTEDNPAAVAKSIGSTAMGFAQSFESHRPDVLVVLGDRFEMYAAALAALPFKIPVAHVHGGELTEGAMDDALRHSMTKLSHLHFVSCDEYARRVIQLGEEPWRVTVCGAPSLDNLQGLELLPRERLQEKLDTELPEHFLLVTYHPVTLEFEQVETQITELIAALDEYGLPVLFTMPNADTGHRVIRSKIGTFVDAHPSAVAVENLGTQYYFSAMALASAMVGNSSSGIIEAASFELPVVNVGIRQRGRVRGKNVVDVECDRAAILDGLDRALDPGFRTSLRGMQNPYGSGHAADTIIDVLKRVELDDRLLVKRFHDLRDGRADGDG